jgi:hypothetical protein
MDDRFSIFLFAEHADEHFGCSKILRDIHVLNGHEHVREFKILSDAGADFSFEKFAYTLQSVAHRGKLKGHVEFF